MGVIDIPRRQAGLGITAFELMAVPRAAAAAVT
jgi:hypothetical protein